MNTSLRWQEFVEALLRLAQSSDGDESLAEKTRKLLQVMDPTGRVFKRGTDVEVEATATELGSLKSAYCNLTISKQTFSVSEPATTGKWLRSYFPVECESDGGFTDYSLCEHSMGGCGSYVRLALNGTNEGEATPCFGIHMVNAAKRPAGEKQRDSVLEAAACTLTRSISVSKSSLTTRRLPQ